MTETERDQEERGEGERDLHIIITRERDPHYNHDYCELNTGNITGNLIDK